jgi:hypothetical protein
MLVGYKYCSKNYDTRSAFNVCSASRTLDKGKKINEIWTEWATTNWVKSRRTYRRHANKHAFEIWGSRSGNAEDSCLLWCWLCTQWHSIIKQNKWQLHAFAEFRKATVTFVMSVCLSVCLSVRMQQIGCHGTDFNEIWYSGIFRESVDKIQVSLKSDKNNGYFAWKPMYVYDNVSLRFS